VVTSAFSQGAPFEASFTCDRAGIVHCTIRERDDKGAVASEEAEVVPWNNFVHRLDRRSDNGTPRKPRLGPVSCDLLFFPQTESTLLGSGFSKSDLRAFLKNNHSVKVYRDNVRVAPYGDPESLKEIGLGSAQERFKTLPVPRAGRSASDQTNSSAPSICRETTTPALSTPQVAKDWWRAMSLPNCAHSFLAAS
jgi:hypothetical protein